jgi:hypothetical protein
MRSMHGVTGQNPFLFKSYEEIAAWHERLTAHEAAMEDREVGTDVSSDA